MRLRGTAQMDARYSFTASFVHAAALFAKKAHEIERGPLEAIDEEGTTEHRGYVVASIMQSVAALEAEISEILAHGPGHHLGSNKLDAKARDFLAPLEDMIDDQEVLHRYVLVLHLLQKPPMPRDGALWENASLLVRLRNAIVHYKSRWGREIETTKLHASLKKLQLSPPPFVSSHTVFFPHQCLGAECARWAVETSFQFLKEFYARLGFPSPLLHVESKLHSLLKPL